MSGLELVKSMDPEKVSQMLDWKSPVLLDMLTEREGKTPEEAAVLFDDTKKFLVLCFLMDHPCVPPAGVDTGWHNWLLLNEDYNRYCREKFGKIVRHVPFTTNQKPEPEVPQWAQQTIAAAEQLFGKLSPNWDRGDDDCRGGDDCQGKCYQCTHDCRGDCLGE